MIRLRTISLLCLLVAACAGTGTDDHHEKEDAGDSGADTSTALPDGASNDHLDASCETACGEVCCPSDQTCCTDQHGHFPQCVSGDACP